MWRTVELKWKEQAGSAQLVIDRQVEGPVSLVQATTSAVLLIWRWDGEFGVPVPRRELRPVKAMGETELILDVSPCQPRPHPAAAEQGAQARPVQDTQVQPRARVTRAPSSNVASICCHAWASPVSPQLMQLFSPPIAWKPVVVCHLPEPVQIPPVYPCCVGTAAAPCPHCILPSNCTDRDWRPFVRVTVVLRSLLDLSEGLSLRRKGRSRGNWRFDCCPAVSSHLSFCLSEFHVLLLFYYKKDTSSFKNRLFSSVLGWGFFET